MAHIDCRWEQARFIFYIISHCCEFLWRLRVVPTGFAGPQVGATLAGGPFVHCFYASWSLRAKLASAPRIDSFDALFLGCPGGLAVGVSEGPRPLCFSATLLLLFPVPVRANLTFLGMSIYQEPTTVRGGKTRGENRAPSMLALVVFRAFLPSSSPLQQRHDQSTGTSGPRPVSRVLHVVFSLFYRTRGAPLPTTRATRISTIAPLGSTL